MPHASCPAFLNSTPLVSSRCHNASRRCQRASSLPTPSLRHISSPRASLVADLVFKAFEVGATTVVTQTFMAQQKAVKTAAKPKRTWFGRRKQSDAAAPSDAFTSALRGVIDAALSDSTHTAAKKKPGSVNSNSAVQSGSIEALTDATGAAVRSVARAATSDRWVKLLVCVMIDLVGSGSLAVPLLGDLMDVVTAPVTAVLLQAIFGNGWITAAGLAEEILPGTDGIPTATLAWLAESAGYLKSGGENGGSGDTSTNTPVGKRNRAKEPL
jgi:hypothetical protein